MEQVTWTHRDQVVVVLSEITRVNGLGVVKRIWVSSVYLAKLWGVLAGVKVGHQLQIGNLVVQVDSQDDLDVLDGIKDM
ncbi:hypothetical protein RJT34_17655 [Clitoria ternatea]|uniref:Uncharacterized protein n=1 Tax=Clitoria ternatea TaxID=43366 RepID=A0AAN9JCG0_CLITE